MPPPLPASQPAVQVAALAPAAAHAAVAQPVNILAPLPKLVRVKPRPRLESLIEAEDPDKIEPFLPPYMIFVKKVMRTIETYRSGRRPSFDLDADPRPEASEPSTGDRPTFDDVMVPGYVTAVRGWLGAMGKKSHRTNSLRGPDSRSIYLVVTCGVAMLALAILLGVSSPSKSSTTDTQMSAAGLGSPRADAVPSSAVRTRAAGVPAAAPTRETIVIHATPEAPGAIAAQKKPRRHRW
jgi:hypothetical protein